MMVSLSFELGAELPLGRDRGQGGHLREVVLARFNDFCTDLPPDSSGTPAFLGLTEGVLLAEEAHERGYETESWVLDEGMAPHERDWLAQEKVLTVTAYFSTENQAQAAADWLLREYRMKSVPRVAVVPDQDWNATWKAAFTGIEVDSTLKVVPPWSEEWLDAKSRGETEGLLAINPGAGFGTGTHETTQLCLKVLRSLGNLEGMTVLDFGSGSGILGIEAARQGAQVYCVEIDPLANDNARENAELNGVSSRIRFLEEIPSGIRGGKVDLLLANILRPILIRFAPVIRDCLHANSVLVLSGLIETDLPEVIRTYQEGGSPFHITELQKNEWRALRLERVSRG
jgi:ribosomal protein L11 methyltransferase